MLYLVVPIVAADDIVEVSPRVIRSVVDSDVEAFHRHVGHRDGEVACIGQRCIRVECRRGVGVLLHEERLVHFVVSYYINIQRILEFEVGGSGFCLQLLIGSGSNIRPSHYGTDVDVLPGIEHFERQTLPVVHTEYRSVCCPFGLLIKNELLAERIGSYGIVLHVEVLGTLRIYEVRYLVAALCIGGERNFEELGIAAAAVLTDAVEYILGSGLKVEIVLGPVEYLRLRLDACQFVVQESLLVGCCTERILVGVVVVRIGDTERCAVIAYIIGFHNEIGRSRLETVSAHGTGCAVFVISHRIYDIIFAGLQVFPGVSNLLVARFGQHTYDVTVLEVLAVLLRADSVVELGSLFGRHELNGYVGNARSTYEFDRHGRFADNCYASCFIVTATRGKQQTQGSDHQNTRLNQ